MCLDMQDCICVCVCVMNFGCCFYQVSMTGYSDCCHNLNLKNIDDLAKKRNLSAKQNLNLLWNFGFFKLFS